MSYAGLEALYKGVGSLIEGSEHTLVSLALGVVNTVAAAPVKRTAGMQQVQADVEKILLANLSFKDPKAPIEAAQANEQKQMDTGAMNSDTGGLNALIGFFQSGVKDNAVDTNNAINMQIPLNKFMKGIVNLIGRWR